MSRLIDDEITEKMLREYADEVGCRRGEVELTNGILKAISYLKNIPTAFDKGVAMNTVLIVVKN